jgi:Protein of unknown function (DUF3489)
VRVGKPSIMDTPQNRTAMPKVNYDAWPKVEEVAATILFLSASADEVASAQSERSTPRQGSKLSTLIDLLGRKKGAGIEDLVAATGWLPHTTRAALTGLRKRGYAIERERSEKGGSLYRIVTGTASVLAA